jgi:hypothetical protein
VSAYHARAADVSTFAALWTKTAVFLPRLTAPYTAVAVLIFHLSRYIRCKYRVLTVTICAAQSKSPTVIGSRTSGER